MIVVKLKCHKTSRSHHSEWWFLDSFAPHFSAFSTKRCHQWAVFSTHWQPVRRLRTSLAFTLCWDLLKWLECSGSAGRNPCWRMRSNKTGHCSLRGWIGANLFHGAHLRKSSQHLWESWWSITYIILYWFPLDACKSFILWMGYFRRIYLPCWLLRLGLVVRDPPANIQK